MAEYRAIIELLWDSLSHGITQLEVKLDSQLMVFQLNRAYQVRNHILLCHFMKVRLLERNFDFITFNHIPRNQNSLTESSFQEVICSYIICWLLQMSFEWFVGFANGASHHTCNLASVAWVI